jgi:hypothetical protein
LYRQNRGPDAIGDLGLAEVLQGPVLLQIHEHAEHRVHRHPRQFFEMPGRVALGPHRLADALGQTLRAGVLAVDGSSRIAGDDAAVDVLADGERVCVIELLHQRLPLVVELPRDGADRGGEPHCRLHQRQALQLSFGANLLQGREHRRHVQALQVLHALLDPLGVPRVGLFPDVGSSLLARVQVVRLDRDLHSRR